MYRLDLSVSIASEIGVDPSLIEITHFNAVPLSESDVPGYGRLAAEHHLDGLRVCSEIW